MNSILFDFRLPKPTTRQAGGCHSVGPQAGAWEPVVRLIAFLATFTLTTIVNGQETIEVDDAQVSSIQNTSISAPIAGIIESIAVSEGDEVNKGDQLIQLDAKLVRTEYDAAIAAMQAAKMESDNDVDARYARRALEFHVRELRQSEQANTKFSGAVSDSEVEKLRLVVDQARLAIEQAEHEQLVAKARTSEKQAAVRIAKQRVDDHSITASVGGQVVEITVQLGEWVEAGKPVVRIISLHPIRVECFVDGRQQAQQWFGKPVKFLCRESSVDKEQKTKMMTFRGRVDFVSPELHPVTGQVRLWATVQNPDGWLQSGMRGKLIIGAE